MRYFFSLGLSDGPRMRRIVNINPDDGKSTSRLRNILAPSLGSRVENINSLFDEKIETVLEDFFDSTTPKTE
jgi:hypothetical protein